MNTPETPGRGRGDDRERSPQQENLHDDTRGVPVAGTRNPLGDGEDGGNNQVGAQRGADIPLKFADVAERFHQNTRLRFKPNTTTPRYYLRFFERLWEHAKLEEVTKRQLAGRMGRDLILSFLESVPIRSRRTALAALECVWTEGIGAPFPVNRKRDFGRSLPPIGTRESPPDSEVRPWAEAVWKEHDSYTKLLVLFLLDFGWRPMNQIGHLRWRNLRYDERGKPYAIIARGDVEAFKSSSSIIAWLPPDVVDALEAWRQVCPDTKPEAFILPWRGRHGIVDPSRCLDGHALDRQLAAFEGRWGLKHLPPVSFRHWVKTACRRLSDPALAALQGHRPPKDGSMRNTYDTPGIERILEEQAAEFPHGAIGILKPPEVTVEPELSRELELLREWKAGRISIVELMARLEALERQAYQTSLVAR